MKRNFLILFLLLYVSANSNISGQIFDYRYHESPAISWNGLAMHDSRQLSMGGISLFAAGHSMQISNPALFSETKEVEIGFSYNFIFYQSFQYWGLNEGVRRYQDPFSEEVFFPSSISVRFGFKGLSITAGWYRSSLNDFPDFSFINEYDYEQYDEFNGTFNGFNESYFVSMGVPVSDKLNAGLKIEYMRGERNVEIADKTSYYYFLDGYYQLKDKRSAYSETNSSEIIIPEIGFVYDIDPKIRAGIRIRYPLNGKVDRKIIRSLSNSDGLSIYDNYIYKDDYSDAPAVTAGLTYKLDGFRILGSTGTLITGIELEYKKWSEYKFVFFGEEEERDVADTVKVAVGAEYGKKIKKIDLYFRLGFAIDRQPIKEPGTILKNYMTGIGLRYKGVQAGIGMLYSHGSTAGKPQDHFIICTSLSKIL